MKVIPVRHVAIIKPDKLEDRSSGGVWLPETARDRMQTAVDRGELVAVGDGFFEGLPGPVPEIGQKVIFDRYAGSLIKVDKEDFRLCNDDKIIAILEE
jgi:chaperonin GroES